MRGAFHLSGEQMMRRLPRLFQLLLLFGIFSGGPVSLLAQDPAMVRHFDYDRQAPLGIKEVGVEQRGDVAIHDITYVSPKGGVVPAYLIVPKGKGPFAAVIW